MNKPTKELAREQKIEISQGKKIMYKKYIVSEKAHALIEYLFVHVSASYSIFALVHRKYRINIKTTNDKCIIYGVYT